MMGSTGSSPMMSISSSLCLLVLGGAAAFMLMNNKPSVSSSRAVKESRGTPSFSSPSGAENAPLAAHQSMTGGGSPGVASIPQGPLAKGLDGRWAITYGGLGLQVDPKDCQTTNVWFDDPGESNLTAWNLKVAPGYEDVYYIRSEERGFDKGCDRSYLTAPDSCTGPITMSKPSSSDAQLWQAISSRDGGYELRSVSCERKRWPSYMISSGKAGGVTNTARLSARDGSAYVLRKKQ